MQLALVHLDVPLHDERTRDRRAEGRILERVLRRHFALHRDELSVVLRIERVGLDRDDCFRPLSESPGRMDRPALVDEKKNRRTDDQDETEEDALIDSPIRVSHPVVSIVPHPILRRG